MADNIPKTAATTDAQADDWWKSAVVYQIYPRSFADSDGDGIGDVRGIIGKLDYLTALGVDVLWLSPIYRSPQDDNGYDISDYQDIDPIFGSLSDVDDLINEAHRRGLKIVMDLVVNHTSDEHPWFVESRASRTSPKRDWYWWRDARENRVAGTPGAAPNNWFSVFGGSAWEYDGATESYYLHGFSRKQPDLNWENPEVRRAVYDMMRWWVDRGVDGFRMDVINLISKAVEPDGSLPDGAVAEGDAYGNPSPYVTNGPRIHEFLQEMNREVLAGRRLLSVGETPNATVADARLYTDPARHEVDMVFTFEHMSLDEQQGRGKWALKPLYLPDLKRNLMDWQDGLADTGWNSLYWDNHDQPRVVSRFGDDGEYRVDSAKSLATVLHLLRGTPYIYQGEEFGMTNAHFTELSDYQDIESVNYAREALARGVDLDEVMRSLSVKSRDNARTPVQWDASPHSGFTTGTPWMPVNANGALINAESAVADPASVFHHYRRLIELRHSLSVVVHGDVRMLLIDDERLFAYVRTLGDQRLLVIANLSGERVRIDLGDEQPLLGGEVLLATHADHDEDAVRDELRPWESRVFFLD